MWEKDVKNIILTYYQKNKIYYRNHRIFQHERGIRLLYEPIRKDYQVMLDDPREHTATLDAIVFSNV